MVKSKRGMPPPMTRREFERNVGLSMEDFSRKIDSGDHKLIANVMWSTGKHLKKLRSLPNGRLELGSIDEMLRLHANSLNWMSMMPIPRQIKKYPTKDKG